MNDESKDVASPEIVALAARTADLRASAAFTARLAGIPEQDRGFAKAIVRFAVPSLVAASLATVALFAADGVHGRSVDDDLAAVMEDGL